MQREYQYRKGGEKSVGKTKTILRAKIRESLQAVLPVTALVLALCFTVAPIPNGTLMAFLVGAVALIVGMGFFTLGAEISMTPMGEYVGSQSTKSRNLWVIILVSLFVGVMITVSEPDLQVLANQVPTIPNLTLILSVAVGVGVFLVLAMVRVLFRIKLSWLLWIFYPLVFVLTLFVPGDFIAVSFDSGGVTTGPMTVPFIMALGVGVASIRSDKHAENDSFGLVALCSIGPILAVLLLGLIFHPQGSAGASTWEINVSDSRELGQLFSAAFPTYLGEVATALGPLMLFFLLYQAIAAPMKRQNLLKILVGVVYTYIGLVLFLTGVNVGFMPAGNYIGKMIGSLDYPWIIIPIGMVIGYFLVQAEPAVHVLTKQVEDITSGAIPKQALSVTLAIGVSVSVGLAMIRVLTGISILWFLLPGYAIALLLSLFVPSIFTSIAFDSGGVASGPMTATFLLPFAMGACEALGGNIVTDAFGVVAMVAMTPLIAIQLLGLVYKWKLGKKKPAQDAQEKAQALRDEEIIEL